MIRGFSVAVALTITATGVVAGQARAATFNAFNSFSGSTGTGHFIYGSYNGSTIDAIYPVSRVQQHHIRDDPP